METINGVFSRDCYKDPIPHSLLRTRQKSVAEWIHFTLVGIILPSIKAVYTLGLMNSATKTRRQVLASGSPDFAGSLLG